MQKILCLAEPVSLVPLDSEGSCPLVQNAPAVLRCLLVHIYREQLECYTTLSENHIPHKSRSLYFVFMNTAEELLLAEELKEQFNVSFYKQRFVKNESSVEEFSFMSSASF